MNSVMGIGESIIFIYTGNLEWRGTSHEVISSTNQKLNEFVFASDIFKKVKAVEELDQILDQSYTK